MNTTNDETLLSIVAKHFIIKFIPVSVGVRTFRPMDVSPHGWASRLWSKCLVLDETSMGRNVLEAKNLHIFQFILNVCYSVKKIFLSSVIISYYKFDI